MRRPNARFKARDLANREYRRKRGRGPVAADLFGLCDADLDRRTGPEPVPAQPAPPAPGAFQPPISDLIRCRAGLSDLP